MWTVSRSLAAALTILCALPAAAFAQADPYVREGIVRSWRVVPWTTVVGREAATPVRPSSPAPAS